MALPLIGSNSIKTAIIKLSELLLILIKEEKLRSEFS